MSRNNNNDSCYLTKNKASIRSGLHHSPDKTLEHFYRARGVEPELDSFPSGNMENTYKTFNCTELQKQKQKKQKKKKNRQTKNNNNKNNKTKQNQSSLSAACQFHNHAQHTICSTFLLKKIDYSTFDNSKFIQLSCKQIDYGRKYETLFVCYQSG